ncbi:MAG: hypothetical protein R3F20_03690 [Planctomycetota bacterium]
MNALGRRDRYLLALLPALVAAALHFWWLAPELDARAEKAELALRRAPDPGTIAVREASLARARLEADGLGRRESSLAARRREQLADWTDPARRAEASVALSGALSSHGLRVIRSEIAERGGPVGSPAQRELARGLQKEGGAAPEVWTCEARGTWESLLEALDAVDGLSVFALPVALSLTSDLGRPELEVKLWIWI